MPVDTDVSPPTISSLSGDNNNENSKFGIEIIVEDWIDLQPKDDSTQYSVKDLERMI